MSRPRRVTITISAPMESGYWAPLRDEDGAIEQPPQYRLQFSDREFKRKRHRGRPQVAKKLDRAKKAIAEAHAHGITKSAGDWATELGMSPRTIRSALAELSDD